MNDYEQALRLAEQVIDTLKKQSTTAKDLRGFYTTGTRDELLAMGGELWRSAATRHFPSHPARRDDPESRNYLHTMESARAQLASKWVAGRPTRNLEGAIDGGNVLLGVYAGKLAIFEIGVSGTGQFGGENLTPEQKNAVRYDVTMHFRLRTDVIPSVQPRSAETAGAKGG